MFRPSPKLSSDALTHRSSPSLGQFFGPAGEERQMALLALSHTPLEDHVYRAMLSEVISAEQSGASFSVRGLSALTGINSTSTIRRALSGLLRKLSIESARPEGTRGRDGHFYQIFKPEEIFERRRAFGIPPYPKGVEVWQRSSGFDKAIERVALNSSLSRREAEVALACAEGMTNAEIGQRLAIGEQTVKFHLRNIFAKLGVRRRTALISRLLVHEDRAGVIKEHEVKD